MADQGAEIKRHCFLFFASRKSSQEISWYLFQVVKNADKTEVRSTMCDKIAGFFSKHMSRLLRKEPRLFSHDKMLQIEFSLAHGDPKVVFAQDKFEVAF